MPTFEALDWRAAHAGKPVRTRKRRSNGRWQNGAYLTQGQIRKLIDTAALNRDGQRDATMIVIGFRHGLRAVELINLRWKQIDLQSGTLKVRRVNNGLTSTHVILDDEARALRKLRGERKPKSKFVFTSDLGKPCTQAGFARMMGRAGIKAGLGFKPHPHMLRHACGHALAEKGYDARALQLYLGHRGAQYAARYMA